jgi:flagellar hook-length control protein FliK
MVGNVGLGKFNPIEMKEAKSSFAPKSSREDSIPSHDSSASKNKPLEKSENKIEKKLEKKSENKKIDNSTDRERSEFDKKVDHIVNKNSEEKPEISQTLRNYIAKQKTEGKSGVIDISKLDKKQLQELEKEIAQKAKDGTEIPQMMMLQGVQPIFVNQAAESQKTASEIKAVSNLKVSDKVSAQTQPVLKFMKAMQENFGISPERIMKALGEMPQETLMESPHEAMTPLFEKLGLQPKQFTKAQILYTEMLTEMEQVQPEAFKGSLVAGAGAGAGAISQLSLGKSELPVQAMEKPMAAPKSTLDQLIEQKISRRALEPQNMQAAAKLQQPHSNMAEIFHIDPHENALSQQSSVAMDKLSEFDPQMRIEDVKINPSKISEQFVSTDAKSAGIAGVAIAAMSQSGKKDASEKEMKDQLSDANNMAQVPLDKKLDGQFAMDKLAPTTAAGVAAPHGQLSNENVEKIISGSQSLIKNGGGEMKIQLNPEGLGKVHLNIKVQDGQVGVQMMADTQEAKKLLESSMSDLKLSLADHKLNLSHVKVDVSEHAQNMNQNHDFKREEARDFLGQFRQFNESFRQNANDISAARAYAKKNPPPTPDIQPIESKKRSESSDGRLHLVA